MLRLAVLASGGGSNFQAIVDARTRGELTAAEPVLLVTDRPCGALERARAAGIESVLLDRKVLKTGLSARLDAVLLEHRIDIVALAGYLSILDGDFVHRRSGRILNIHPSLLPRHGGPGMYGHHVHQAVLASGDRVSGCTVHLVTQGVDEGEILGRAEVPVLPDDTAETLAARILAEEHRLYPRIIEDICLRRGVFSER